MKDDFHEIARLAAAQLPAAAHMAALNLAAAHGHLWGTLEAQGLLASASNTAELEAALLGIQGEAARLNGPDGGGGPLGLELQNSLRLFEAGGDVAPCYSHTTGSGRLAWNIVPGEEPGQWFMTLSVCRPAVTVAGKQYPEGVALEARYSSTGGWDIRWGMGAPFYSRHLETLADAIAATGLVEGPLDDLPLIAHSIHSEPRPDWRDGKQWWDVKLAAGRHERQIADATTTEIKAKFGSEPLRAFAQMAVELDNHGVLARVLRDAT